MPLVLMIRLVRGPPSFVREQLVSTMDAERALRIRTVEVPRIKAVAPREGSIVSAEGKGKPYIINPVALKVRHASTFSLRCAGSTLSCRSVKPSEGEF